MTNILSLRPLRSMGSGGWEAGQGIKMYMERNAQGREKER